MKSALLLLAIALLGCAHESTLRRIEGTVVVRVTRLTQASEVYVALEAGVPQATSLEMAIFDIRFRIDAPESLLGREFVLPVLAAKEGSLFDSREFTLCLPVSVIETPCRVERTLPGQQEVTTSRGGYDFDGLVLDEANKRPEGTEGKCPPSKHSQPPSVPHP